MAKRKAAILLSKLLGLAAVVFVSTASYWLVYRPEVPSELKK
jgi:cyclic lactone autoinducer peptide